jgi:two-component system, sensor histidine kinase PdtaS
MSFLRMLLVPILVLSVPGCKPERKTAGATEFQKDTLYINSLIRHVKNNVRKDPEGNLDSISLILKHTQITGYLAGKAEGYWLWGQAEFYRSHYDSALSYYNTALALNRQAANRKEMAKVELSRSYAYSAVQQLERALSCVDSGFVYAETSGDFNMSYQCAEGLIYLHEQMNHTLVVDSLIKKLPVLAARSKNHQREASSYIVQGNYYLDKSYMNLAIEAFYKALTLAESWRDTLGIANAMGSIALANLYLKEYQTAVSYYLKQEALLKRRNDQYELGKTYTGLGEASNALGNFRAGLSYHMQALDISNKLNFLPSIGQALHNVGFTYYLLHDSAGKAFEFVQQSMAINRKISNQGMLAANYLLSGKIYMLLKKPTAAIPEFEKSIALGRKFHTPQVVMDASLLLSRCYAEIGNYSRAYLNIMAHKAISDSLISGENLKRITQLEMQRSFDREQHETRMKHLQESIRMEARLRKNRLIWKFIMLAGLFLAASGVFFYRNYRKTLKAEKEKEVLLKEIHHRVKNNLMVISSLLNLQSGAMPDDHMRNAVKESQNRVMSMALIHQMLYQSERFTGIDFPEYLRTLLDSLMKTYRKPGQDIRHILEADPVKLDIDTAIPLGLITNELVSNALKYAFPDNRSGIVSVRLISLPNQRLSMTVEDNGIGMPSDFDPEASVSLGLKLVRILARQIRADWKYTPGNGTAFTLVFEAGT